MRRPLIAANWKMNKTIGESVAFVRELLALDPDLEHADAAIFPPFTALAAVHEALGSAPIGLGAQSMWYVDHGPYTGEISTEMLLDCGVTWVILGHSERRALFCVTDEGVNRRLKAALRAGITPIVAVGETAEEHATGRARARVIEQTRLAFAGVEPAAVAGCVVAYEPVWAIGRGSAAEPATANDIMGAIRAAVDGLEAARILYGGSVTPANIGAFVAQPHIDGALVGTASLDPRSFTALIAGACAPVAS